MIIVREGDYCEGGTMTIVREGDYCEGGTMTIVREGEGIFVIIIFILIHIFYCYN